jgi:hypothetical protein
MSRLKPFYVEKCDLLAPKDSFAVYRNVYVFEAGTEVIFRGRYVSTLFKPSTAKVVQSIDEDKRIVRVLFPGRGSYYECDVKHKIDKVGTLTATASISWRLRGDVQTKNYEVGLFDWRDKPVSEYPVSGADNAVLDLAYSWKDGNFVYPPQLPEGLSFTDMALSFESGFCPFKGRYYKDPTVNNVLRLRFRVLNNTGKPVTIKFWGAPFSVLYEDLRHVSQVNINLSVEDRMVQNGYSTEYSFTINIPPWAYGKIAPALAFRIYRNGMLVYGGGPFFQASVGRLLLP